MMKNFFCNYCWVFCKLSFENTFQSFPKKKNNPQSGITFVSWMILLHWSLCECGRHFSIDFPMNNHQLNWTIMMFCTLQHNPTQNYYFDWNSYDKRFVEHENPIKTSRNRSKLRKVLRENHFGRELRFDRI